MANLRLKTSVSQNTKKIIIDISERLGLSLGKTYQYLIDLGLKNPDHDPVIYDDPRETQVTCYHNMPEERKKDIDYYNSTYNFSGKSAFFRNNLLKGISVHKLEMKSSETIRKFQSPEIITNSSSKMKSSYKDGFAFLDCELRSDAEKIVEALFKFLVFAGYTVVDEHRIEKGSWKKKFKTLAMSDFFKRRARLAEDTAVGIARKELDVNLLDCARNFIASLDNTCNAVVEAGPIIVLKITKNGKSSILVKRMSIQDQMLLNENPELLEKPQTLLSQLKNLKKANSKTLVEASDPYDQCWTSETDSEESTDEPTRRRVPSRSAGAEDLLNLGPEPRGGRRSR